MDGGAWGVKKQSLGTTGLWKENLSMYDISQMIDTLYEKIHWEKLVDQRSTHKWDRPSALQKVCKDF